MQNNITGVAPTEELGRGVFSSKTARRAKRGQIPSHVFLESRENPRRNELSVDRLSMGAMTDLVVIAEQRASARNRRFYGWAVVVVSDAAASGRQVVASPLPNGGNPFHADIVLPASVIEDEDERKHHAEELATLSAWQARPED